MSTTGKPIDPTPISLAPAGVFVSTTELRTGAGTGQ